MAFAVVVFLAFRRHAPTRAADAPVVRADPGAIIEATGGDTRRVTGSRENVAVTYERELTYADGSYLYGQVAAFPCGTHDWEHRSVTIRPAKLVKSLTLHALFRGHAGTVWFDDLSLKEIQGDQPDPASGRRRTTPASARNNRSPAT